MVFTAVSEAGVAQSVQWLGYVLDGTWVEFQQEEENLHLLANVAHPDLQGGSNMTGTDCV